MACYKPIEGFRGENGGLQMARHLSTGIPMSVPCGRCIGCRLEKSRQWAVRMMHEASLHEENCFLTLTYSDENLPEHGSLDKTAFPKFMKRLRKAGVSARYFHCGEYGEETERPHYHACMFGFAFPDRVLWTERGDHKVFRSPFLERKWGLGQAEIGSLTFESAAYCARYVVKKITGRAAAEHYERLNPLTGELIQLEPEFATMSRNPGIGAGWLAKFGNDVYPSDEVIVNGRPCKPPRYYDRRFEAESPEAFDDLKQDRRLRRDRPNQTPQRLRVREVCAEARLSLNPRGL